MFKAPCILLGTLFTLLLFQSIGFTETKPPGMVRLKNTQMLGYELCPAEPWILKMIGQPKTENGHVVTKVYHGGAAEKAGLREGDLVTHLDDQAVQKQELLMVINSKPIGSAFIFTVQRGIETLHLPFTTVYPPQISDPTYERDAQEVAELQELVLRLNYETTLQNDISTVYRLRQQIRDLLKRRMKAATVEGHPLEAEKTRKILNEL